jgi:5-methylcytosine-specific restriction endonuclease McrA
MAKKRDIGGVSMAVHSLFLSKLNPVQRQELVDRLHSRQNGVCFLCELAIDLNLQRDALEIDHIVPIAYNGKDEENNFAMAA